LGSVNTIHPLFSTLKYEGGETKWGFEVDSSERKYEWFKLEQDPKLSKNELARKYPKTTIIPESDEQVEKLVTDYLRLLRQHVENKIRGSFQGFESLLRNIVWEYIITVPAMWLEPAQNITLRCAMNAGMAPTNPVQIVTEPEAAGIYALDDMCREMNLAEGDTFVICDAGGG
jgi:molecular chaperone DnaK (HSP70)